MASARQRWPDGRLKPGSCMPRPHRWFGWCTDQPITLAVWPCWACPSPRARHFSRGPLCGSCYNRWYRNGFAGPGPGPNLKPPIRDSAREYADVIKSMPARQAAERLGRSAREIVRWRAALREAS
jgi:hypothetical protein